MVALGVLRGAAVRVSHETIYQGVYGSLSKGVCLKVLATSVRGCPEANLRHLSLWRSP